MEPTQCENEDSPGGSNRHEEHEETQERRSVIVHGRPRVFVPLCAFLWPILDSDSQPEKPSSYFQFGTGNACLHFSCQTVQA
jgi:hypothetical protein